MSKSSEDMKDNDYLTHYKVTYYCTNCEYHGTRWFEKRTKKHPFRCPNCGCSVTP